MTKAGGWLCPASQGALMRRGRAFGGGYTARIVEPLRDQDCAEDGSSARLARVARGAS